MTYEEVIKKAGGIAEFQKSAGLKADGVAGPKTNNAILRVMLGLSPLMLPSDDPGPDKIRRPALDDAYGKFSYEHFPTEKIKEEKDKGRIVIDPVWEAANIVNKKLWDGQSLKLHKDVWEELNFVFKAAVDASGYHPTYTVGYKPRHTLWKPTHALSTHSWGCAVDFDCSDNDLGGVDAKGNPSKMRKNPKFVQTFEFWGWSWYGRLAMKDDMHLTRSVI